MDLKLNLSNDSISELGKIIKESIKEEIKSLFPESKKSSYTERILLNRKQASVLLGCSLTTLYYYQKDGRIPFHQVGRKILFDKDELLDHLKVKTRI